MTSTDHRVGSRRLLRSAVSFGSLPANTEEERRFVQQRLSLYGATVAWISGVFAIAGSVVHLATGAPFFSPERPAHLVGTFVAVLLWSATRTRRTLPPELLGWLDAGGTLAIGASYSLMAFAMSGSVGSVVGLAAIAYVTLGRAAQVPSTKERTLLLAGLSFSGLFVAAGVKSLAASSLEPMPARLLALVDPFLWCATGTALATVVSKVIYGLQQKVVHARKLGQYVLEEKIGEGGMGEIYRARHALLRRPTAIKLLAGRHTEEHMRRFEREVQLTASLTHPNTICVFDYGRTPDGLFYYAMELLDGQNLETLVQKQGPQPAARVIQILLQVCGALSEAHRAGLIHRDIKPANIHLGRRGGIDDFVKVLDFGLVRAIRADVELSQSNLHEVVGTPLYMSPEAFLAPDRVDARADIYGLGATAYHLLAGTPPFDGTTTVEVCGRHLYAVPEPLSERSPLPIPEELERLVLRCLAKDPNDRPESTEELLRLLRKIELPAGATGDAPRARPTAPEIITAGARQILPRTVRVVLEGRPALQA